jgi:hypothetical protein
MTPAELLTLIENLGGHLEVSPDGHLRALHVPSEFHATVCEHQDALITLLQERAKPRSSCLLIPATELAAAQARYQQTQAAKAAPAPAAFDYKPRTLAQHDARERQTLRSSFGVPVERVLDDPEIEGGGEDTGESPKSKTGPNTLCTDCGHKHSDHHITPEPHVADDDHTFYCVTSHCDVYSYKDGVHKPCDCQHFRALETDAPKLTRPRVGNYDRCANPTCGHWKINHCTKAKPGKVARLKPGESAYKILSKSDGTAYPCKHFSLADPACQCTSTSCAATADGKTFCNCEKFISPLLRTRAKAPKSPAKPRTPRKSRSKKTAFLTGAGELLSPPAIDVRP